MFGKIDLEALLIIIIGILIFSQLILNADISGFRITVPSVIIRKATEYPGIIDRFRNVSDAVFDTIPIAVMVTAIAVTAQAMGRVAVPILIIMPAGYRVVYVIQRPVELNVYPTVRKTELRPERVLYLRPRPSS